MENICKIIDLFCGTGAMSFGAMSALKSKNIKPQILLANDIQATQIETYQKNHADYTMQTHLGDVSDLNFGVYEEQCDLLLAGPPCQGFSSLNNHTRLNDKRSQLYLTAVTKALQIKPKLMIIENVPNIRNNKEDIIKESKRVLEENNYHVQDFVIDVSTIGIPQKRLRHILIASKDPWIFEVAQFHQTKKIKDVLEDLLDVESTKLMDTPPQTMAENRERINYLFDNELYDLPDDLRPPCHRKKHSYRSMYGRLKWDGISQTITTGFGSPGQGRFIHPLRRRLLTPREAARLQGFTDDFSFEGIDSRVKLQELIGNAAPPKLTEIIVLDYQNKVGF